MNNFKTSINKVFNDALKSFSRFPVSILSAVIISIIAIIRINMESTVQVPYVLLFDSLQLALLFTAIFSMAAVAYAEIQTKDQKKYLLYANGISVGLAIVSFAILYLSGTNNADNGIGYLSTIAIARVVAATIVSAITFVYIVSTSKLVNNFSDSFFMSHRAFIISTFYGLVIMIGVSGVFGAFEALVYNNLSFRVYEYLGVIVGFLTFTIFLGYFPSFKEDADKEKIEAIIEQPRVILVLLDNILVPIMLALTVVLLLWSARVLFTEVNVSFQQLSSIATSYVIIGIWLHIMVANHDSKLANFYKTAYPVSALLVLALQAWALIVQVSKFGIKTAEYSFSMIWIFAVVSVILILIFKNKAYRKMAVLAILITVVWVLPIVGYRDLSFNSQVSRLEKTLVKYQLLVNGKLVKTDKEISQNDQVLITDSVAFITYSEKTTAPSWFDKKLNEYDTFKHTFGFEQTWDFVKPDEAFNWYYIQLDSGMIDVKDYPYAIVINNNREFPEEVITFEGRDVEYEMYWSYNNDSENIPRLIIKSNNKTIIDESLESYFSDLVEKYPLSGNSDRFATLEDMTYKTESDEISVLLVFSNVQIGFNTKDNSRQYYVILSGVYLNFK